MRTACVSVPRPRLTLGSKLVLRSPGFSGCTPFLVMESPGKKTHSHFLPRWGRKLGAPLRTQACLREAVAGAERLRTSEGTPISPAFKIHLMIVPRLSMLLVWSWILFSSEAGDFPHQNSTVSKSCFIVLFCVLLKFFAACF